MAVQLIGIQLAVQLGAAAVVAVNHCPIYQTHADPQKVHRRYYKVYRSFGRAGTDAFLAKLHHPTLSFQLAFQGGGNKRIEL